MTLPPFVWVLVGLFCGALFTWAAVRLFPRLGLLDFPQRYDLTRSRIPYPGGVAFVLPLLFAVWYFLPVPWWALLFLLLLVAVSFYDDRTPLSPWLRLGVHILVALGLLWAGVEITHIGDPFGATNLSLASWPWLQALFTLLWVLLLQNALNFFDGIPGLAVGMAGIGFLALGVLGLVRPELLFDPTHMPITQGALWCGALCLGGFVFYARGHILLGDTGSHLFGVLLAVWSIVAGAKIATTLLVLWLPIMDAGLTVLRRLWHGVPPWKGDREHIHHVLQRKYGTKYTLIILLGMSILWASLGIFLVQSQKFLALIGVSIVSMYGWWVIRHP